MFAATAQAAAKNSFALNCCRQRNVLKNFGNIWRRPFFARSLGSFGHVLRSNKLQLSQLHPLGSAPPGPGAHVAKASYTMCPLAPGLHYYPPTNSIV